ncbi:MAG: YbhN family protein [bacterium]
MNSAKSNTLAIKNAAAAPLPREKIYKGLVWFAMFTVASLAVLFYATSTPETLLALTKIDYRFLLLAAFLQIVDIGLGGWRNHILVQKCKPGVKPWLCFKAQLANEFGAAVTPGQSGGGPAWLYVLHRGGISLGSAVAVSVTVFLTTLIFMQVSTSVSAFALSSHFTGHTFQYLLRFGFVVCTGLLLLIILSLIIPGRIGSLFSAIARKLHRSQKRWRTRLATVSEHIAGAIKQYQGSCMLFMRKHCLSIVNVFLITGLYYLLKLHLAYVILLGLGIEIDYFTALALLALLRFILYFSPTPGGSGIGEISIAALMSSLLPMYLLPVYTILYRFFLLFLPAAFGAWVLLSELKGAAVKA